MRPIRNAQYKHVAGLSRGLAVLWALNRTERGWATAVQLSQQTGLHRTTVRRLLETLLAEGYLRRSADDTYRLTLRVRELSEGFTDDEWISEIAAPVLGELLREVVWPSDLTTLDGDALIIRETMRRFSPLSFHRDMVGRKLPLLYTAAGRAYFAFCSGEERKMLLKMLIGNNDEQSVLARNRTYIKALVNQVWAEGVATNDGEWKEEPQVAAVALPVRHAGKILCCINVVYRKRVMTIKEAIARYLPALRAAVTKIEVGYAAKSSTK